MYRLCATQRVLKRFRLERGPGPELRPTTSLGNWYANLLNVGSQRWVLCVSDRTLLPVIVAARNDTFPKDLPLRLGDVLGELGVDPALIAQEQQAMAEVSFDRTHSRQILGAMNDFSNLAGYYLEELQPFDACLKLGETPSKPIGHNSPANETVELFRSGSH